jgi:O-antigen/teichoic acid export membrane protein
VGEAAETKSGAREFAIDTAVVAVTQLLLKLRGLVTIPLIVKILGTAEYGVWVQVLTFIAFLGSLFSGNLHVPLVRFIAGDTDDRGSVYSTILGLTAAAALLGGALICLFADPWSEFLIGAGGFASYIYLSVLIVLFGNVRQLNVNVYRATGRLMLRSASELFATFGQLIGIALLLWQGHGLLYVFVFMAVWEGAIAVVQTWHVFSILGWARPQRRVLADAARYAAPLIPAAVAAWALDRGDRFVIGYFMGPAAVGVYSAQYALAVLLMSFQLPFQVTLLPKVAALWDRDREAARRYINMSVKFFLTLAIPFSALMLVLAPELLRRIGNREIAEAAGLNTLLIAAGVLLWAVTLMQNQVFHGARQTKVIGATNTAAALVNLALNLALIPLFGIAGAALATLVTFAGLFAVYRSLSRDIMRLDFHAVYVLKCAGAGAAAAVVPYLLTPLTDARLLLACAGSGLVYVAGLLVLRAFSAAELAWARRIVRRKLNLSTPRFSW